MVLDLNRRQEKKNETERKSSEGVNGIGWDFQFYCQKINISKIEMGSHFCKHFYYKSIKKRVIKLRYVSGHVRNSIENPHSDSSIRLKNLSMSTYEP